MLFTTPEQFIVLGVLLVGGWLLGFACAPSPKKWKRRVREQSDSFTEYHAEAEERARAANQRATDLKSELAALRADHAEAERTIAGLRTAAAAAPVAAPVAVSAAERPALSLVEPEPIAEPAAEPAAVAEVVPPEPVEVEHTPEAVILPEQTPEPIVAEETEAETETPPVIEDAVFEPVEPVASVASVASVAPAPMTPTPTRAAPAAIGPAEPEMPSKGWFASSARDELTRIRGIDGPLNTRLFGMGVVRFEDLEKLSAEDEMALEQRLALPVGYVAREQWRTQAALLRAGQDDEHATHFGAVEA